MEDRIKKLEERVSKLEAENKKIKQKLSEQKKYFDGMFSTLPKIIIEQLKELEPNIFFIDEKMN